MKRLVNSFHLISVTISSEKLDTHSLTQETLYLDAIWYVQKHDS